MTRSASGSRSGGRVVRRHEVVDDGIGHGRGVGKPAQQRTCAPTRRRTPCRRPAGSPRVRARGLRGRRSHRARSRACRPIRRPGTSGSAPRARRVGAVLVWPATPIGPPAGLGVDHAVAHLGQRLAQRTVRNTECQWRYHATPADLLHSRDREAESEDWHRERPRPRERGDDRRRRALLGEVPTQLPRVGVHTRAAFLPEHGRDDQGDGIHVRRGVVHTARVRRPLEISPSHRALAPPPRYAIDVCRCISEPAVCSSWTVRPVTAWMWTWMWDPRNPGTDCVRWRAARQAHRGELA